MKVRPHSSGAWTYVLGKSLADDGTLKPKQFYFRGTEADAQLAADAMLKRWGWIMSHWGSFRSQLDIIGSKFADVPHWNAALGKQPTADEVDAVLDEQPTADEIAEMYADVSLKGVG